MKTQVFVVAGVRLYREALTRCLAADYDVLGTAPHGGEAVRRIAERRPAVVLVDMAVPESALTVRAIIALDRAPKVVALGVPETEPHVLACAEAGISGYVSREASLGDLAHGIESVARGEALCSPRIAASLLRRVAILAGERPTGQRVRLTTREHQIVDLIDQGLSNKEIARRLCIEVATVKNHVHNILEKLQVHSRSEAASRVRLDIPWGESALSHARDQPGIP
jgi:two-component system nitrate/nitrite response regulator NarL